MIAMPPRTLITGAAGNLGSLLSRFVRDNEPDLPLFLMEHRTTVPDDLRSHPSFEIRKGDLSRIETLDRCLDGVDTIVHFAGVLFRANPEKFLPETNVGYFKNLLEAAAAKGIARVILISFPHVEGPTSRQQPAIGKLDGNPISVHAKTRLEEEKLLFEQAAKPVSLRVGMVYGKGILMVDAAKWFAKRRLLGVWREPTQIHLISKTDFCRAALAAIQNRNAGGIYHVGDEGNDSLQSFLDLACDVWGYHRPWRMPLWLIYFAARAFESVSKIFDTASPLTGDFIDIGRVPYFMDTKRFRKELLPDLIYPIIARGIKELRE